MNKKNLFIIYFLTVIFTLCSYSNSYGQKKNSPPSIKSIKVSKSLVQSSEKINLTVLASDINKDKITYSWTQTNNANTLGSFSNIKSATTYWTAPKIVNEASFNLQIKVIDSKKAYTIKKISVTVKPKTLSEFDELKDSVVDIKTDKGEGTGFIISSDGWILTNSHIIKGASTANVLLNSGENYPIDKIINTNYYSDLAIIKINLSGLKPIKISKKSPKIGDSVFTISNSLGKGWSISTGKVNEDCIFYKDEPHLQITNSLKPENSGGPLFDLKGEVLGLVQTGTLNSKNINLAYPINLVQLTDDDYIDATFNNFYSNPSIMERLDYTAYRLNKYEDSRNNPLFIGKRNIGRVTYYNDTWDDNGSIEYAFTVGTSYEQFLSLYQQHKNQKSTFNDDFYWHNYSLAIDTMSYGGIDPITVYYLVVDDLDSPPPTSIIPAKNVTYINGKYHVEYYYYYIEVDKDLYYDDYWYTDDAN